MTEQEWGRCVNPYQMLEFLRDRASERKLRLFACACCRLLWDQITSARCRAAVETTERYADGQADRKALIAAGRAAMASVKYRGPPPYLLWAARGTAWSFEPISLASNVAGNILRAKSKAAGHKQLCALLRDVFGLLPWRAVAPGLARLAWGDGTVVKLARSFYDERAFEHLPVLADALEEAGCTNAAILEHLRGPGPLARGCWAVDVVLGRP